MISIAVKSTALFFGFFGGACAEPTCAGPTCVKPLYPEPICPPLMCVHPLSDVQNTDTSRALYRVMGDIGDSMGMRVSLNKHDRCCKRDKKAGWKSERCYFPGSEPCRGGEFPVTCLSAVPASVCLSDKEDDCHMCPEKPYTCRKFLTAKEIEENFNESYGIDMIVKCVASGSLSKIS